MRINYNASAATANKHLLGIENNLSKTMERLSSGLKINQPKDNPAGMAISNKMQAQIHGLNRASQNSLDGISVIQIADGALNETTNILQRMRELSVQAASEATMSLGDKQAIQAEIESLKAEVNRISTDTEYNSKILLDGSLDVRVYSKSDAGAGGVRRIQTSDAVKDGMYSLTVKKAAEQAGPVTAGADFTNDTEICASGVVNVNGANVQIEKTDTYPEILEKIRNTAEVGETAVDIDTASGELIFKSAAYGRDSVLNISVDNEELADKLGLKDSMTYQADTGLWETKNRGTDAEVVLTKPGDGTGFSETATTSYDGNRITVTDTGGFSLSFLIQEGYEEGAAVNPDDAAAGTYDGQIAFEVTDIGSMTLHIGANMNQNMEVRIGEVSAESLYIDDLDVTTVTGADRAMSKLDAAIAQVSDVRSKLGAYENRLEYTGNSLDAFEENMTGAISRLTDADMAEEMTNYTHQNVLNQAAISVLTQANDLPQQVLQILQ